jgi:TonB-linked SusC/RagA family outer membrane protein
MKGRSKFIIYLLIILFPLSLFAQQEVQVRGRVTEAETGEPLPGVSIVVENSSRGVITDVDGTFEIRVTPSAKLTFTFIGMTSQTIEVGSKRYFEIMMNPVTQELEEFTVVAFGTQKKESVVGAISTVKVDELKVPTRSMSNTLGGRVAGIISVQRSGEPGNDDAQFWIRGISTFGAGSSPLVLVDGVERSLSNIEPEEIESFSVLKDASATAMYGIRGANGVILINTRKGKSEKPIISVKAEIGASGATRLPKLANAVTTYELYNEANLNTNPNFQSQYTPGIIELYRNQSDPVLYPDVDWMNIMIKDWAQNNRVNVNVSGGGDVAKYFVSATYYDEGSIWKGDKLYEYNTNTNLKRWNFRANTDLKVNKYTNLNLGIGSILVTQNFPGRSSANIWDAIMRTNPGDYLPIYPNPDGSGIVFGGSGNEAIRNPYADLVNTGYQTTWNNNIQSNISIVHDLSWLAEGFKIQGMFSFDATNYHNIQRTRDFGDMYRAVGRDENGGLILNRYRIGQEDLGFVRQSSGTRRTYIQASLNYDRIFRDHTVSGLVLYNQQEYLDAGAGSSIAALPYRLQGLVGRLSYSYQDKYFAEINAGYNGSENFKKGDRFGLFPSFALGWIISNERFFKENINFLEYLKLRGSFGYKGNDDIGGRRFAYLTTVGGGNGGYNFGKTGNNYYAGKGEAEWGADLTWEREEEINLGLETRLLKGLYFQADVFRRYRTNIFMQRSALPDIMGLTLAPWGNIGIMDNKGIETTLEYRKMINKVDISLRGNFTYARNKIIENDQPSTKYYYQSEKGLRYGQPFGLVADGLYVEDDFIDFEKGILKNYLPQPKFGNNVKPGDIKYVDINSDGVLDTYDRVPIGDPSTPEIVYGFGTSLGYKGFDFSVFFQGAADMDFMLSGTGFYPFAEALGRSALQAYATDRWTQENPSQNVLYPRLSYGDNPNNYQSSTWWQRDAGYLRLKSIELGYSLPKKFVSKAKISTLRVYLVGYNLFTWSKFKYWDPELGSGNGASYPIQRNFSIGINVNF